MTENVTQTIDSTHFTGPVFTPDDAGYAAEIAGFQTAYTHRPALVVGAVHAEDVRAAVEYAARHGLPAAVQATGHGLSVAADRGVLITTRRMDAVTVDARAHTARVGAGVRAGALVEAAARHGLAPLTGSSPSVGVVGYVLGGGVGLLAREFGYAADHVRAIDLVTADGRMRTLTPADDLFGAVLGSGGNFGVVTGLELDLMPVTEVYGGQLIFDTPLVDAALEAWRAWTATLPDTLTSTVAVVTFPDIAPVPEPLRGRHVASIRVAYDGPAAEGERLVAPLRAIGDRLRDDLRTMPYIDSHTIHSDPDFPHAYAATNALLSELTPGTLAALRGQTAPGGPVDAVVDIRHLGGALRRGSAAAVDHRDAAYVVRVITDAGPGDAAPAGLAAVRAALAPWTIGHSLNFLYGAGAAADAAQTEAGFAPATYTRLAAAKATYDPRNMFRFNRNIAPA
ncbi:FAD-binding oxidoreductase [Nocardia asteroides NBRC 15531]|uniref:Oxidoreductase n=1 Tax=Nocardia asteroides NBRC 15531 TaxID=1110697 RepID=U5EJ23_NOCAS|nr:FAD-binding oxidoreductase [Nocardia asteroides]TLF62859.1 FAD-binding oxidoreductase [Nocardia asteroides NBRC 15531]UGT46523.1 FAD-binding oxidoreductase [Nocardia asteroides]SFN54106.1 FAD/FMN-containing dehydrogenase [Nocardia asteroides]VEG34646.1 Mitomycin radical oxidase [Nocardia asteroides]GAD85124.1 putative oxidoreductase [Nocardia asteroides NBRC 15531]